MSGYLFSFTKQADKQFSKLSKTAQGQILDWISVNIEGTSEPRIHGKALQGSFRGLWRYRVGKYRLVVQIKDKELLVLGLAVAKRDEIYR